MASNSNSSKVEIPGDCMECRIVGVATLSSLSLYANHLRMLSPKGVKGHRIFLGSLSAGDILCCTNIVFM